MEDFHWTGDGHVSFDGGSTGGGLQVWDAEKTHLIANIFIGMAFNSETGHFYITYKNILEEGEQT